MTEWIEFNVEIETEIKEKAELILSEIGIAPSDAVRLFYQAIVDQGDLPFDLGPMNRGVILTKEDLYREIDKGLQSYLNGDVKPMDEVFDELDEEC
ncbi:type II toxin-antitoxin system RelB/DinJ family antitoxin [Aerococcaceae bacterium DSM 111176]|nr:type II toxin-antitoxin system RelB/DinJ family antitoxin [Aerococcaceae bacterium DSM 111176]